MLNLFTDKQKNRQMDKQTDKAKSICQPIYRHGGMKNIHSFLLNKYRILRIYWDKNKFNIFCALIPMSMQNNKFFSCPDRWTLFK